MKKRLIVVIILLFCLSGCGTDQHETSNAIMKHVKEEQVSKAKKMYDTTKKDLSAGQLKELNDLLSAELITYLEKEYKKVDADDLAAIEDFEQTIYSIEQFDLPNKKLVDKLVRLRVATDNLENAVQVSETETVTTPIATTIDLTIDQFRENWVSAMSELGKTELASFADDEFTGTADSTIYKSRIGNYIFVQATLDSNTQQIKNISLITIPPDPAAPDNQTDYLVATGTLATVMQPELSADERGDIIINHLGLGLESTDLTSVKSFYVYGNATYILRNIDGMVAFGIAYGDVSAQIQ